MLKRYQQVGQDLNMMEEFKTFKKYLLQKHPYKHSDDISRYKLIFIPSINILIEVLLNKKDYPIDNVELCNDILHLMKTKKIITLLISNNDLMEVVSTGKKLDNNIINGDLNDFFKIYKKSFNTNTLDCINSFIDILFKDKLILNEEK